MKDTINLLVKEIEALKGKISQMEQEIEHIQTCEFGDEALYAIDTLSEAIFTFCDLDQRDVYTNRNLIILHRNCFRSYALLESISPEKAGTYNYLRLDITPEYLLDTINNAKKGDYIVLKDNIFHKSAEYEKIISDALNKNKVLFAIYTTDITNGPKTICDKCEITE